MLLFCLLNNDYEVLLNLPILACYLGDMVDVYVAIMLTIQCYVLVVTFSKGG